MCKVNFQNPDVPPYKFPQSSSKKCWKTAYYKQESPMGILTALSDPPHP